MEADTRISTAQERSWLRSLSRGRSLELQGFWAIADQGVVSLGNFLTTIIVARAVSPEVYGIWTVIFGLILFLNVVHGSLITYPLSVRLASRDDPDVGQLVVSSLALTALLALPQALILFGASFLIGGPVLALWAILGLMCWQLQETTRRALMARLAFRTALFTDAISYLGQAGLLWLLARNGKLTPEVGFAVIALTCGVAAVVQVSLMRVRLTAPISLRDWARSFWRTGYWVLGSSLVTNFSIQAVPWALFLFRGPAEAAGFQAISNLLGVAHPIMLSLGNIVVPAAARAHMKDGLLAARRVALRHAAQGGLLLLPYVAALLIFPRQLLGLFYGSSSPYVALDSALRLLTVIYALHYVSLTLKYLLNALEKNRPQFVAELCGSLLLAGLVVPLVLWFGLPGAILATGLWLATRLTGNMIILRQVQA
ncbi:MAG: lipopolysaccharide biosynthesis protein [Pyrinomonadaceae bacterium]